MKRTIIAAAATVAVVGFGISSAFAANGNLNTAVNTSATAPTSQYYTSPQENKAQYEEQQWLQGNIPTDPTSPFYTFQNNGQG
jgi:type IV secretory pathway protease TraF